MASKATVMNDETRSGALQNFGGNVAGTWDKFSRFLSDVRAEMRKVVVPSRKEVESTTTVVLVAVFLFGLFFFVVDALFRVGVNNVLNKLSQ